MTRNVVTTELVADQPVVVVLHHDQDFLQFLRQSLDKEKIATEYYSITELLQSDSIKQRLHEAYKIAWLTGTQEWIENASEISLVDEVLVEHQHKITLFFPVMSIFVEQVPGELPYAQNFFEAQTEAILFHNSFLPSATFLFGQDLASKHIPTSFLHLLCQNLDQGLVYSPKINLHPQSIESYFYRAVRYFLQPQRSSILVRGNSSLGTSIAAEIKQLYQSYHFSMVDTQEVLVYSEQTIPFSVVENFVTDDVSGLITTFVQSLPTPASLPKTSVWKKMFGSLLVSQPEYGIEVEPSHVASTLKPEYEEIITESPVLPVAALVSAEETNTPAVPKIAIQVTEPTEETPIPQYETRKELEIEVVSTPQVNVEKKVENPKEDFDLHQEIQSIFSTTHVSNKKSQDERIQQTKKVLTKKTKKKTAVFYGGLAFTGMGLGIVCLAMVFMFSVNVLKKSVSDYLVQKVTAAETESQLNGIMRLRSIVNVQAETYSLVLSLPALEEAQNLVELTKELRSVTDSSAEANRLAEMLYLQAMGTDSGDVVNTAQNLNNKSLTDYESLSGFYDKLTSFVGESASKEVTTSLENYKKELDLKKTGIQSLQQITPLLSNLLGVTQKRTYAFILQNNQELRPTGGFIEDVALVTFENGAMISATVFSGYEIDSKLNGSVIPPEDVKRFLGEEDWNFVDGNWNPHFPESATQLSWFIEKSMGTTIDGVITIDLNGLATVLEATGPLDLPQYNEVLTHKNIFDRFEFHSEISLVDAKDDYRKQVFQAFINRITSLPQEKVVPFFAALQKNVSTQHMLISFSTADELNTVKALGWSGSLLQPGCPSQLSSPNCVVDTVAQVEANVGINKANYYLKRTIDHSVALEATQAAHSRTITFTNTAQTESWPKGAYKTYVRLFVPSSALPGSILVDGLQLSTRDIQISDENNRKVIGFYVEIPVKQSKNIQVNYTLPYSNADTGFSYTFFEQQQPGSGETPFTLRVTSYSGLRPSVIAPQASFENGVITFSKNDIGHGFFGVKYN